VKTNYWKTKLAVAFGERIGEDVRTRDIRVRGAWLFYRHPDYPDDIECYHLPLPICAEPWTDIPAEASPFTPNNAENVARSLRKLDDDIDGD
jgi:hypothetical protein